MKNEEGIKRRSYESDPMTFVVFFHIEKGNGWVASLVEGPEWGDGFRGDFSGDCILTTYWKETPVQQKTTVKNA